RRLYFFLLMHPPPPRSTLFPYTTLFRSKEDVTYLLEAINMRFPGANLTLADIETGWSGLRPLIQPEDAKDPSDISREHEIFISRSEEHTSELQSRFDLVCRLLLEKKKL